MRWLSEFPRTTPTQAYDYVKSSLRSQRVKYVLLTSLGKSFPAGDNEASLLRSIAIL